MLGGITNSFLLLELGTKKILWLRAVLEAELYVFLRYLMVQKD